MKTISIINLKGGVAKTISAANIAHILATKHDKRVLLVDNDKQGNVSKMFGVHDYDAPSIADILTQRKAAFDVIINTIPILPRVDSGKITEYRNLSIIPANMNLLKANLEVMLDSTRPQQTRLRAAFKRVSGNYDYCIIDCAPDINISTINALVASDEVFVPIKIDNFAFDGLAELKEQVENVREDFNPDIKCRCFVTCYQNNEVNRQGEEWLREQRSEYPLFNTHIRRTVKIDESTFANAPILEYSPRCGAAKDYMELVAEYLNVSESDTKGR
ncbi:MAG: ParA family protein [Oscillospiraceae bacterium]